MTLPRQQHYVWAHYLQAWEINGLVQVSRNGGMPFSKRAHDIAKEKDFYRLPVLEPQDIVFIKDNLDAMGIGAEGKSVALSWMEPSIVASSIENQFQHTPMPSAVRTALDYFLIRQEEDFHGKIETNATSILAAIRQGNTEFWDEGGEKARLFCFYIAVQHLRTKKMAHGVSAGFPMPEFRGVVERTWPYLKFAFATNVGLSLYVERKDWRMNIVDVGQGKALLVSDQPVMNLRSAKSHFDMALYYPISPTRALLIEHTHNPMIAPISGILSSKLADELNLAVAANSHQFVFAAERDLLTWCQMNLKQRGLLGGKITPVARRKC